MSRWWVSCKECETTECYDTNGEVDEIEFHEKHKGHHLEWSK